MPIDYRKAREVIESELKTEDDYSVLEHACTMVWYLPEWYIAKMLKSFGKDISDFQVPTEKGDL